MVTLVFHARQLFLRWLRLTNSFKSFRLYLLNKRFTWDQNKFLAHFWEDRCPNDPWPITTFHIWRYKLVYLNFIIETYCNDQCETLACYHHTEYMYAHVVIRSMWEWEHEINFCLYCYASRCCLKRSKNNGIYCVSRGHCKSKRTNLKKVGALVKKGVIEVWLWHIMVKTCDHLPHSLLQEHYPKAYLRWNFWSFSVFCFVEVIAWNQTSTILCLTTSVFQYLFIGVFRWFTAVMTNAIMIHAWGVGEFCDVTMRVENLLEMVVAFALHLELLQIRQKSDHISIWYY